VGASFDSKEDNAAFAKKFNFNFPLLCDVDRKAGQAYGADPGGGGSAKRIGYIIGPDGKVKHAFAKVKAAEFPKQALELI
jgi:peroxiredoxin Q/BCP